MSAQSRPAPSQLEVNIVINLFIEINDKVRNISYTVDDSGCWICTSHKPKIQRDGSKAYYSISSPYKKNKVMMIHQLVYRYFKEDYENGLCVRHKCDNPLCINPEHLEVGTHQDNMDDMYSRKKDEISISRKGSRNGNRKLSEEDVENIRLEYSKGNVTQKKLSEIYNVSSQLIQKIVRYEC